MTRTYAVLEVSPAAYAEIREKKLKAAGYDRAFHEDDASETIDMHGIALRAKSESGEVSEGDPVLWDESWLGPVTAAERKAFEQEHARLSTTIDGATGFMRCSRCWHEWIGYPMSSCPKRLRSRHGVFAIASPNCNPDPGKV